ncbi:carbonic anhydrase family protein [Utexia brackfieldae]|uniref:carbonic anhydrase n=1 Tax=Utexia brackfieldae TaxID=3074108 RepID=UPI00370D27CE
MKIKFKVSILSLCLMASSLAYADPHWTYEGKTSPEHWGELDKKWETCHTGSNQSPINIDHTIKGKLDNLAIDFHVTNETIVNNGHTIQVTTSDGDDVTIDNVKYSLKQFHFHSPSENHINGQAFPVEIHFVHANDDNQLAVVAVMVKEGKANPVIDEILKDIPAQIDKEEKIEQPFNFSKLFPTDKHYYRYSGSLTTPPCTEGVTWFVMKEPVEMSKQQITQFQEALKHSNNRPLQALNGRLIVE